MQLSSIKSYEIQGTGHFGKTELRYFKGSSCKITFNFQNHRRSPLFSDDEIQVEQIIYHDSWEIKFDRNLIPTALKCIECVWIIPYCANQLIR